MRHLEGCVTMRDTFVKPRWMSPDEVAATLGVSRDTIDRELRTRWTGCWGYVGRQIRIDYQEVCKKIHESSHVESKESGNRQNRAVLSGDVERGGAGFTPTIPGAGLRVASYGAESTRKDESPSRDNPMAPRTDFRKALWGACERAGLPALHPHALRHTGASRFAAAGATMAEIMAAGGWSSPEVPMRIYAHAHPDNLAAAAHRAEVRADQHAGMISTAKTIIRENRR